MSSLKLVVAAAVGLTLCLLPRHAFAPPAAAPVPPLDPANLDRSINPGDDFYHYAEGTWLKNNPIPADHTSWGSFDELEEHNNNVLYAILNECAAATASVGKDAAPAGSVRQLVGDFYASGMDEAAIEMSGTKSLAKILAHINELPGRAGLPALVAELHHYGVYAMFQPAVEADEKDADTNIAQILQGGLSLPDRDYYTKTDDASRTLRGRYVDHVARMFTLLGDAPDQAAAQAATVLRLETALAQASKTAVELRDPQANYHKTALAQLVSDAPGFDWAAYFAALGAPAPGELDVKQPEFAKSLAALARSAPLSDWQVYLRWHLVHALAAYLPRALEDESFRFFGTELTGAKEPLPRWKRVLRALDESLGEALGQLYVARAFPPEAKARALSMIDDLKAALRARLSTLEWMGTDTRAAALRKLDALAVKVGYPDRWRDYSPLEISRRPYVLNVLAANAFESHRQFAKIGRPVDRTEWGMTPPTVNAYYNPSRNEIVFPAGILQPPFFGAGADDAVNYGGMGAVIGHEMTHGFDDQGRQYDEAGNLRNWWSAQDLARFNERAQKIIAQFAAYEPLPGVHVNGELTQGENIADLGGSKIAFAALERALARQGQEARDRKIDGFGPEQRFFLSWAQVWRINMRPEMARLRLNTDPHSPGQYRCNGPLSNLAEFRKAFAVPAGAPMVRPPADQVSIW